MLHVEANALQLQPSPSSWSASFCLSSSLEPQDHRRWPATVQGEAPLLVCGCSLWVAPATCQHSGARSLAKPLTLQEEAGSFRPACWGRLSSPGQAEGRGVTGCRGSTASGTLGKGHGHSNTVLGSWALFLGVLRMALDLDTRKRASKGKTKCPRL